MKREEIENIIAEDKDIILKIVLSNGYSYKGKIVYVDNTTCQINDYKKNLITIVISEIVAVEEIEDDE